LIPTDSVFGKGNSESIYSGEMSFNLTGQAGSLAPVCRPDLKCAYEIIAFWFSSSYSRSVWAIFSPRLTAILTAEGFRATDEIM